mgnify:CR=1 FL=1
MKKISITLTSMLLCSSFLLYGCSTDKEQKQAKETKEVKETTEITETDETLETSEEIPTEETTSETSEPISEYTEFPDQYNQVLVEMVDYIADFDYNNSEYNDGFDWIYESIWFEGAIEVAKNTQYCLFDMNNDGTSELIILSNQTYDDDTPSYQVIDDIYTIEDGEVKLLLAGYSRNIFIYQNDGSIFNTASSGAFSSFYGDFYLDDDLITRKWNDFYFTDYNDSNEIYTYYNQEGIADTSISEIVDDEDLWNITESYIDNAFVFEDIPTLYSFAEDNNISIQSDDAKLTVWAISEDYVDPEYDDIVYAPEVNLDYANYVTLATDKTIYNLVLFDIKDVEIDDDGNMTCQYAEIYSYSKFDIWTSLVLVVNFDEYLPTCGLSYEDTDGTIKSYLIQMSGEDGSLYLTPFTLS